LTKFFDKTYVGKKIVTASKGTKRKRRARGPIHEPMPTSYTREAEFVLNQDEVLLEEAGNTVDTEELELADTQACDARESLSTGAADDPDRTAHDDAVVKGLSAVAIAQMKDRGVDVHSHQAGEALKILPKVY
jgi:hypothetical protein